MNPIRIHPVTAGLTLAGPALLGITRAQQPQLIPRLTPEQLDRSWAAMPTSPTEPTP